MRGAHLWKRILNEGILIPQDIIPPNEKDYAEQVRNKIITCPIIVDPTIQPLGDYDYNWSRYLGLSIPFPNVWIEGDMAGKGRWGCKVTSIRITEKFSSGIDFLDEPRMLGGWFVQLLYVFSENGSMPHCIGRVIIYLDVDGNLLEAKNDKLRYFPVISFHIETDKGCGGKLIDSLSEEEIRKNVAHQVVQTTCDVLLLLGCKNVSLLPHDNDPKEVRRAVKRYGSTPGNYRYHTLIVRPAGSKPGTPGQEIGMMPRHVCRGHFSEYGPEFGKGLLFGKYSGRFFIPPCIKGDKKNGIVEKDYAIPAM